MPDQLPPGPALDERVCRALGWEPTLRWGVGNKAEHSWVMVEDDIMPRHKLADWLKEKLKEFPYYFAGMEVYSVERWDEVSTDGNVMLRAVEAMRERGWLATLKPLIDGYVAVVVSPVDWSTGRNAQQCLGESLPHATALAILAALEPEASDA